MATSKTLLARLLSLGMLSGISFAVTACGSSRPPTILNSEKVERAIEAGALAQRGKHVQVSCPAGVHQKKGLTLICTTLGGGSHTRFVVTQLDGLGHVHYNAP